MFFLFVRFVYLVPFFFTRRCRICNPLNARHNFNLFYSDCILFAAVFAVNNLLVLPSFQSINFCPWPPARPLTSFCIDLSRNSFPWLWPEAGAIVFHLSFFFNIKKGHVSVLARNIVFHLT